MSKIQDLDLKKPIVRGVGLIAALKVGRMWVKGLGLRELPKTMIGSLYVAYSTCLRGACVNADP